MRAVVRVLLLAAALLLAGAAVAMPRPAELCRAAAGEAAARHGVPLEVMRAIALVETGTRRGGARGPWPWTLNVAGEGAWFDSRAEAAKAASRAIAGGERSVDLGCFQINFRWHGEHFEGPHAMLDPRAGADYAARFLAALHAEAGDWPTAIGWYHSRTPVHARRYRRAVARAIAVLGGPGAGPAAAPQPAPERGGPSPGGVRLTTLQRAPGALLLRGRPGG